MIAPISPNASPTPADAAGSRLHPQMAAAIAKNAALQPQGVDRDSLPIARVREIFETTRRSWNGGEPRVSDVADRMFATRHGEVACRIYRQEGNAGLPLLVYLHGGGWVLGSLDSHDCVARTFCRHSGADVVSIDYALAPEHGPFVAIAQIVDIVTALDDREAPDGIVLCGDSAGAHLAVLAALEMPEAYRQRVRGVASFYGVLSRSFDDASGREFGNGAHGLTRERMAFYWSQLIGAHDGNPRDLDPLDRDLSVLPPAMIVAAECDVLRDGSKRFAQRLRALGKPVNITTAPGMAHAYLGYAKLIDQAAASAIELGAFCRSLVNR